MSGRVLGWLTVSHPPEQTASELAEALSASKGSISTATRSLLQLGLIEKVSVSGERAVRHRIAPGAWRHALLASIHLTRRFRQLAEQGLAALPADSPAGRERLQEMHDVHAFFESEYPKLLERYDAWRAAKEDA
jgi:DNA-binding transcriptional regulator GbsR (MarR family)